MSATLINHRGAREVTLNELTTIEAPPPTDTWFPISHFDVWHAVHNTLRSAGYEVTKQRFSLARDNHRFFGVLDLQNSITNGVSLACGLRNSTDKSFPIGLVVGSRVMVCDNLAFHGEVVISKKHTRFGRNRYEEGIAAAVASLGQYQTAQAQWIDQLRSRRLTRQEADSLILRSYEEELISSRVLPFVLSEWRNPEFEEFRNDSAWALFNAFTRAIGLQDAPKNPAKAALTTIKLQRLMSPEVIDVPIQREQRSLASADAGTTAEQWLD